MSSVVIPMPKIHETAIIHPNAVLGKNVEIGPYAVIDEEVVIEQGCKVGEGNNVTVIGYHCVALENATVEDGAMIYPDTILHQED